MEKAISIDPKDLEDNWSQLPKWVLYISTLPSALVWLGVIIKFTDPILAIVMIFASGIPTKLLYYLYQMTCIFYLRAPSPAGHMTFFFAQSVIYLLVFIYVQQP